MSHVAFDFETYYSSKYSVRTMIAEQYANHEDFEPYMLSISNGTQSWAGDPRKFDWSMFEGEVLVAHNAYFDYNIWLGMARRGWAPYPNFKELHCTADMTSYLCNKRALDDALQTLYGIVISKDVRSDAKGKHWPQDFSDEERAAMLDYARKDAYWCWKLFEDHKDKWPRVEREMSRITREQGCRGVQLDRSLLDHYTVLAHEMKANTEQIIPWIKDADDDSWDDFNAKPTSSKCIAEQCRRSNIPGCPVKKEDEEAYQEWEDTFGPSNPWIYAVSQWRSVNKLVSSFKTIRERLRDDDTMPFALKYFGAHTGRWTAGSQVNMQNQRKRPMLCNERMLMETNPARLAQAYDQYDEHGTWPEWVKETLDFRALIVPRPGKKMIVADLSQIEPRVLSWFAKDHTALKYFGQGLSAYEVHARASMGWTGGELKKENPGLYALAKARVLALGYGCGWQRFIGMALSMANLDITKDDPEEVEEMVFGELKKVPGYGHLSRKIVKDFRESNAKIVNLWNHLEGHFRSSVGGDFNMTLPSGRVINYRRVSCDVTMTYDPERKRPVRKEVWTAETDKRRSFYGGKLCENLVQATSRDIFGEQLVSLDAKGVPCLFSVHDEGVFEVDKNVSLRDISDEMSRCPEWMPGCPISADANEVEHYTK